MRSGLMALVLALSSITPTGYATTIHVPADQPTIQATDLLLHLPGDPGHAN